MNFTENEFCTSNNTNTGINSTPTNNYDQSVETIAQSNDFTPQSNNNYDSNGFKQPSNNSDNNENIKKIVIGVIAVAVVIGGFFGIKSLFGGNSNSIDSESLSKSSAFTIKNSDDKYALFNNDGTKLTDFVYKYVSGFFNGTAIVTTENGDEGLISQSGKMIIPAGKYAYISEYGGLYKIGDEKGKEFLANSSGKIIVELESEEWSGDFADYYVMLKNDNSYIFMNHNGTKFLTIAKNKSISGEPITEEKNGLLTIFYNGKNYIYNDITGKKIVEFADSSKYCIYGQNANDSGEVILRSCIVNGYSSVSKDFKYVANGSVKFKSKNECDALYFENGSIFCSYWDDKDDEAKDKIYNKNGNKSVDLGAFAFLYSSFNSYVRTNEKDNSAEFYENGKLTKSIDCFRVVNKGYSSKSIYELLFSPSSTCKSASEEYYQYYKSNGEPLNSNKYEFANDYDINGLALVANTVGRSRIYSLINTDSKVIADGYRSIESVEFTNAVAISFASEYYIVKKDDNETVINSKGEVIISSKGISGFAKVNDIIYFVIDKNDEEYTIYNINTKKEVITINKDFEWNDNYIKVTNGTKYDYYTFSGKLFYIN